ncbi:MAG TPA: glycosyltransferase family 39 protein [Pyrinomonadaceae bacterium]|nr:glycosyltransferase family 39 protein [Pyrinomonadaceae bacterium]
MQGSTLAKRDWLLLLAAALAYFYGLGVIPFVGPDEPRYAQVAREMFERGDLVTPTLAGRTWFEKPALTYWAAAAGYKLFGVSEWAARLGSALCGLLTIIVVGWVAGRVERRAGGGLPGLRVACAGVAASSAGLIVFSRAVNFDIYLAATVSLALGCYVVSEYEEDARRRCLLLAAFYAGMGLSLLAKGLVGVVLPVGVVALYWLLRRRRPSQLKSLLWGMPLAALVACLWYAPVIAGHGREFMDEFFVQHHFARYTSNRYNHPQPFYFYLLVAPLLALPWTAFLAAALMSVKRSVVRRRSAGVGSTQEELIDGRGATPAATADGGNGVPSEAGDAAVDRLRLFALAWLVAPVAFFSLSGSKLPGYILPALPGAVLLAGERLARYARGGAEWPMRATGALLLAFAAACVGYAVVTREVTLSCALLVAAPAAGSGVCVVLTLGTRATRAAVVVGAALLTTMLAAGCAAESVARRETVGELLRLAAVRGHVEGPVLNLHTVERAAEFYAAGRLLYDEQGEPFKFEGAGEIVELLRGGGGAALVIVPVEYEAQVGDFGPLAAERVGDNGRVALYAVRLR